MKDPRRYRLHLRHRRGFPVQCRQIINKLCRSFERRAIWLFRRRKEAIQVVNKVRSSMQVASEETHAVFSNLGDALDSLGMQQGAEVRTLLSELQQDD